MLYQSRICKCGKSFIPNGPRQLRCSYCIDLSKVKTPRKKRVKRLGLKCGHDLSRYKIIEIGNYERTAYFGSEILTYYEEPKLIAIRYKVMCSKCKIWHFIQKCKAPQWLLELLKNKSP